MLDSPHYIGTASKGYGFKANWARTLPMVPSVDPNYKPRRINKAIELWEDNQVVAYAEFGASGAPDTYEEGKRMAKTYCDAINYEMENDSFSFDGLRNFMQGLVDGGPTPSGHRTPMVFVTLPAWGFDGPSMRANVWQIHQALAAGAHGVPDLRNGIAGSRPRSPSRAGATNGPGRRGGTSHRRRAGRRQPGFRRPYLGRQPGRISALADTWPHNPKGEITMGFKLENRRSAMAAEQLMAVKGLAFAEPGPSDNGWSHLGWDAIRGDLTPRQRAALPASKRLEEDLERIRLAAKANKSNGWAMARPARRRSRRSIRDGAWALPAPKNGSQARSSLYQAQDALLNASVLSPRW